MTRERKPNPNQPCLQRKDLHGLTLNRTRATKPSCLGLGFVAFNPPPWGFASRGGEVSGTAQHFEYALAVRVVSKLKKKKKRWTFYILNIN